MANVETDISCLAFQRSPIVRTIYEKEALFESLDAAVAELKEYIVGAVHRAELHQVEQQMFRQLQQVGRHGLETFVALSGTGYEAANPPLSEGRVSPRI